MDVRNIANDCEKLARKAEDYVVETSAENVSVECDSAQAKAVGELKDNDSGAGGVDVVCPMRK